jgi:hypothetical protein
MRTSTGVRLASWARCALEPHATAVTAISCADVNAALGLVELFAQSDDADSDEQALLQESRSAYVELLQYAPCLVRFEDRAEVFQQLVQRDREVRGGAHTQRVTLAGHSVCVLRPAHMCTLCATLPSPPHAHLGTACTGTTVVRT